MEKLRNDIDMSGVEWSPIYPGSSGRTYTVDQTSEILRRSSRRLNLYVSDVYILELAVHTPLITSGITDTPCKRVRSYLN